MSRAPPLRRINVSSHDKRNVCIDCTNILSNFLSFSGSAYKLETTRRTSQRYWPYHFSVPVLTDEIHQTIASRDFGTQEGADELSTLDVTESDLDGFRGSDKHSETASPKYPTPQPRHPAYDRTTLKQVFEDLVQGIDCPTRPRQHISIFPWNRDVKRLDGSSLSMLNEGIPCLVTWIFLDQKCLLNWQMMRKGVACDVLWLLDILKDTQVLE
jgi:hypothetical protein